MSFLAILTWALAHWRGALLAALVAMLCWQTKTKHDLQSALDATKPLELKPGEIAKVQIDRNNVRTGGSTTGSKPGFVPPESRVDITVKENQRLKEELDRLNAQIGVSTSATELEQLKRERDELAKKTYQVEVKYQRFGFTFRPGLGALYSGEFFPEVDIKVAYGGRYSLKAGLTLSFVDAGISRHVDDLIPWFRFQNLEVQAVAGMNYAGGWRAAIGVRSNL